MTLQSNSKVYCIAHYYNLAKGGRRSLMLAYLRYKDTYVKQDGKWYFAERILLTDFLESREFDAIQINWGE